MKNNNNIISSKEISIVSTVGLISIFFIGSVFDVSGVSLVPRRDHHKLLVLAQDILHSEQGGKFIFSYSFFYQL